MLYNSLDNFKHAHRCACALVRGLFHPRSSINTLDCLVHARNLFIIDSNKICEASVYEIIKREAGKFIGQHAEVKTQNGGEGNIDFPWPTCLPITAFDRYQLHQSPYTCAAHITLTNIRSTFFSVVSFLSAINTRYRRFQR